MLCEIEITVKLSGVDRPVTLTVTDREYKMFMAQGGWGSMPKIPGLPAVKAMLISSVDLGEEMYDTWLNDKGEFYTEHTIKGEDVA